MRTTLKRAGKALFIAAALSALVGCVVFAEFYFGIAPLGKSGSRTDLSLPELSGRLSLAKTLACCGISRLYKGL